MMKLNSTRCKFATKNITMQCLPNWSECTSLADRYNLHKTRRSHELHENMFQLHVRTINPGLTQKNTQADTIMV
uniref:Uncharacterized protein n=1 Tax=Arundo donax TaxID=35708 RepID=A0A0A9SJN2_ARUDO